MRGGLRRKMPVALVLGLMIIRGGAFRLQSVILWLTRCNRFPLICLSSSAHRDKFKERERTGLKLWKRAGDSRSKRIVNQRRPETAFRGRQHQRDSCCTQGLDER